jgi:hypothetical protein
MREKEGREEMKDYETFKFKFTIIHVEWLVGSILNS